MSIVQYYEMYRMVVLLNPSTTIGTNSTDGNLWSRSVKPSLPCVKHVGRHHKGSQSYGRMVRMVRMVT